MYALKARIHKIVCQSDPEATFAKLVSGLRKQRVEIKYENRETGRVAVRCLSVFTDFALWRCWSDELLFEVEGEDGSRTSVSLYAIPNLMRIKVGKNETPIDLGEFVTRLVNDMR